VVAVADDAVVARTIDDINHEILRQRADSLAVEQSVVSEESRESVLLFSLGEEWYGLRIGHVREIYNEYSITPVPCVPSHIAGVINIRGEIVSVTDIKAMMGMGESGAKLEAGDEQAPVIVVAEEPVCTALIVDAIGDIVEIATGSVEAPLSVADKVMPEYVSGEFYTEGRLVALVNTAKVLTPVGGE
jgi:purine-binding chemotaxis protein CheW